ncbi:MAG: hypothetical protein IJM36_05315 [Acholeplasmatales bacterium]|nr:hypothetical protein [Acholeplasmatales bacterium]
MKKILLSIIINSIIFVLMVLGLVMSFTGLKFDFSIGPKPTFASVMKFFTVESNIFMGIMALLFVINAILHLKANKEMNRILFIFKYIATVCVAITFLTVTLILTPIFYRENIFGLFYDANFLFHFVIPVLSIITFILFENRNDITIKITITGMIPFIIYTIFYLIASLTHMENGKVVDGYDWYGFLYNGIPIFILLSFVMILLTYLISFIIYYLNKKLYKSE